MRCWAAARRGRTSPSMHTATVSPSAASPTATRGTLDSSMLVESLSGGSAGLCLAASRESNQRLALSDQIFFACLESALREGLFSVK